jgi:hypothetical protein
MTRRSLSLAGLMVLVGACDSPVDPPPIVEPEMCRGEPVGLEHGGLIESPAVWRAEDGPHLVVGRVQVDMLTIEAGALVCGAPNGEIWLRGTGALTAIGSEASPIIFTAQDSLQPWRGIAAGSVRLSHALVEHALVGVGQTGSVIIDHSVLRQIQGAAVSVGGMSSHLSLVESTVDSACLTAEPCAAVSAVGRGATLHFEESVVRNSGGDGVYVSTIGSGPASRVTLVGGAIEGSGGIGLVTSGHTSAHEIVRPVRITGGSSYPVRVHFPLAADHLVTAAAQELWRGNARDTVLAHGAGSADSVTIRPGLPWSITEGSPGISVRRFRLEPGAVLALTGWIGVDQLISDGTSDAPVEIEGGILSVLGGEAEESRIVHTRLSGVTLNDASENLVMRDVMAEAGRIILSGAGARLTRVLLAGGGAVPNTVDLTIAAADIHVSACEVEGGSAVGILVEVAEGVRINDCNIHGTMGVGLRNTAAGPVDARHNWWGDPAGPHGPDGVGVEGDVLFEPWRTEPVVLDASD